MAYLNHKTIVGSLVILFLSISTLLLTNSKLPETDTCLADSSLNTCNMEQRDSSMAETSAMLRMGSVNTANRSVDNLSIPDMSASLSAKVSVSHEEQSAPHLLAKVYDNMAAKFFDHGLNLDAVAATGQYFNNLDGHGKGMCIHLTDQG